MFEEKRDNPVAWDTLAVTIGDFETNLQHKWRGIRTCPLTRDTRCDPHLHCDRQNRHCETGALQQHRTPLDFILSSFAQIRIQSRAHHSIDDGSGAVWIVLEFSVVFRSAKATLLSQSERRQLESYTPRGQKCVWRAAGREPSVARERLHGGLTPNRSPIPGSH